MATLLYSILIIVCFCILVDGMIRPARVYQFPFGAAAVFIGFIAPPLFGLLQAYDLPHWATARYIIMCILCLAMCWLGDAFARAHLRPKMEWPVYDSFRWLAGATILILVGAIAYVRNRVLFQMEYAMNTGAVVAINFFVFLLRYGFIMAVVYFLRTKSRYALALACLAALYYGDRIVFFGRRMDTIEFTFVLVGSLWLVLGKAVPRTAVIVTVVAAALAIGSVGAYRQIVVSPSGERDWSRLTQVDPIETFRQTALEGSTETVSGIYLMAAGAHDRAFDFGLYHWNSLVFNYVPAQLFGADFKESLYLPLPDLVETAARLYGFRPVTGTTVTGMVDCFSSFWYLGCLKFFLIAAAMQWLYQCALHGSLMAESCYLFMMCMALHAITHHTQWFISPWVHMLFFWFPVMLYARTSAPDTVQCAC